MENSFSSKHIAYVFTTVNFVVSYIHMADHRPLSALKNCQKIKTNSQHLLRARGKGRRKEGGKKKRKGGRYGVREAQREEEREKIDVLWHSMYYLLNCKNLQLFIMYDLTCQELMLIEHL